MSPDPQREGPQPVDAAGRTIGRATWATTPLVEATPKGKRLLITPVGPDVVVKTPLNMPRDTWAWLWKDAAGRVAPFLLASWAYAAFTRRGASALGLRRDGILGDIAFGTAVGLPLAQISALFRRAVSPGYHLPTPADQAAQSAYYFLLNAPAEEFFWRGALQSVVIRGLRVTPGLKRMAGPLGWAATTAAFGAYHRFGGWSWKSIAGVTAAGGVFGAMFALPRRKSILPAIIAHGFATAGFLNWGDVALHRRHIAQMRRRYDATPQRGQDSESAEPAAGL